MKKKILVTGGAGYIGSHTMRALQKAGYEVTVFDNLSQGHKEAVDCKLIRGDLLNNKDLIKILAKDHFDGVIHFAALALAGESMEEPYKYFQNNVMGGLNLVESLKGSGIKNIVFSSTCAVYGFPKKLPVTENAPFGPMSVYGETKLMFEKVLKWYDELFNIRHVNLRYFNAAGTSLDGKIGQDHQPFSHIIPIAIETALGKRKKFVVNGDNYDTKDGTCVRDYIHVEDLATAHIAALEYLFKGGKSDAFNVGTGQGYSIKEIIEMVKKVSGKDFKVEIGPRRDGDPDAIYADNSKIKRVLKWKPKHSELETIIKTAWKWHKTHPNGYSS